MKHSTEFKINVLGSVVVGSHAMSLNVALPQTQGTYSVQKKPK